MSITEFLLARIAEEEANAADCGCIQGGVVPDALVSRREAECEAKRRIVEHASQCDDAPIGGWCYSCHVALCALASVYSDHPDYREDWRP